MGDLNAAQTVCVGFLSSPGEGAVSWVTATKIPQKNTKIVNRKKTQKIRKKSV
jgi:hypothetical protein